MRGLRDIAARVFNLYLNSPEEVGESELVTGVCVPLVWSGSRWPDPVDGAGGRPRGGGPRPRGPRRGGGGPPAHPPPRPEEVGESELVTGVCVPLA